MPINTLLNGYLTNFNGFTNQEMDIINQASYFKSMEENSTIIGCDSICTEIYFLTKGKVRVHKILPDGKEITLYRVLEGEMCLFSLGQILDHEPFDAIATIEEDAEFLVMPEGTFMDLLNSNSSFRNYILKRLISSLSEVMLLVEELTFKNMNKRVAKLLIEQLQAKNGTNNMIKLTHEQIASELGTAREVVSRLLKEFESQSIVTLSRGKVLVNKLEKLKKSLLCDFITEGNFYFLYNVPVSDIILRRKYEKIY